MIQKWVVVRATDQIHRALFRFRVPGGWLYKSADRMVFVPLALEVTE